MSKLSDKFSFRDFTMRSVRDTDIDALVEIINEAYSYQDEAKGASRTNPEHLQKRINETDFYVVLSGEEVIGCIYLESKNSSLHFGLLTLSPDYRGIGLAQAMMAAVEEYGKEGGFSTLALDYMSLAPWLKEYYEGYGFSETGSVEQWGRINLVEMKKVL